MILPVDIQVYDGVCLKMVLTPRRHMASVHFSVYFNSDLKENIFYQMDKGISGIITFVISVKALNISYSGV